MTKADRDQDRPVSAMSSEAAPGPEPQQAPEPPDGEEAEAPSADIQRYIGAQLRAVYDDVASQPVPDRFVELMKRLG